MVYYSYKNKASFIHIPKCGGVYIRELLLSTYNFQTLDGDDHPQMIDFLGLTDKSDLPKQYDKHTIRKFGKYRFFDSNSKIDKKYLNDFFTFTFVRNPYDRIYSAYKYLRRRMYTDGNTIRGYAENMDFFKDFNTFIQNKDNVSNISYFHAFITQYSQLLNESNNIKISFIGKTESLDNEFIQILTKLDIPIRKKHIELLNNNIRYNVSKINTNITDEINQDSLSFINKYFKKDFEIFGYKVYNTIEELKTRYTFVNHDNGIVNNTLLSKLTNLYMLTYKTEYNVMLKEDIYKKVSTVSNILLDTVSSTTTYVEKNELKSIRKDMIDVNDNNNHLVHECKNNIYIMKQQLLDAIKEEQQQFIVECNICKYKTFNILATNVHKMLCNDINIKGFF